MIDNQIFVLVQNRCIIIIIFFLLGFQHSQRRKNIGERNT